MPSRDPQDPYLGNILIERLGTIPSPEDLVKRLTRIPPTPDSLEGVPYHVRLHMLMCVRDLHLPPLVERQLGQTTDLMIRQRYAHCDPLDSRTWRIVSGEPVPATHRIVPGSAAIVEGHSGTGKTEGCHNCLDLYPPTIWHEHFPRLKGGLLQVVSLSAEVPASGKSTDLARALMEPWRRITGSRRFDDWLYKEVIRDGMRALDEWRQVAMSHFLGILHLDEVQNFFKLSSLKQRKNRQGQGELPELSIVEDQCLRWVLNLINTSQISVLFSGTPDGIGALTRRLSTLGRLTTMGYHPFEHFADPMAAPFRRTFLEQLRKYQYVRTPLPVDDALAKVVIELSGGIQRFIIALWVAAHRVAFERKTDDLRLDDFRVAALTWLAPLAPAVAALRSGDPEKMARYEDLVVRDTVFWGKFWQAMHSAA